MTPLVLLVENNDDARELESSLAEEAGYRTLAARSGRQALSFLEDVTPNVVVTDFMLPDMDGVDVAHAMRADGRLREIPIIIVTGAPPEAVVARLASCAVDVPVLTKPLDPDLLIAALRSQGATLPHGPRASCVAWPRGPS